MKKIISILTVSALMVFYQNIADSQENGYCGFFSSDSPNCNGYFNIYSSIKGGSLWSNKLDTDPVAQRIHRDSQKVQNILEKCGITVYIGNSDTFSTFTPDLVVVHSNSHSDMIKAKAELERAKSCGVTGFTKKSKMTLSGSEDGD